jgi:hypothetical protein
MKQTDGAGAELAMIPFTVPEVRRLLWRLMWATTTTSCEIVTWSHWRRRHQAHARQCHWRRRTRR